MKKLDKLIGFLDKLNLEDEIEKEEIDFISAHGTATSFNDEMEAIAFMEFDMPDKIRDFINEYIDRDKSFQTILQNKLQGFYDDLEWSLPPTNPLIHKFFTFS